MFELEGKGGTKINFSLKDRKVVIIGRGSACDLQLDSEKLSRKHCILRVDKERVTIEDLGSKNGMRINGKKIKNTVEIQVGDELGFSDAFTFVLRGPATTQASAPQAPVAALAEAGERTPEESKFGQAFAEIHAGAAEPQAGMHLPAVIVQPGLVVSESTPVANHPAAKSPGITRNMLYVLCGIGVLVLLILMNSKGGDKGHQGMDSHDLYAKILDNVVEQFEKGSYNGKELDASLSKARSLVANNEIALILIDIAKLNVESSGNFERYNWIDAKRLTGELIDAKPKSPKVEKWANAYMTFLVEESRHINLVMEVRQHLAAQRWKEVLQSYKKIPDDCMFKKMYRGMADGAQQILAESTQDAAKKAFAQSRWSEAVALYENAKIYAPESEAVLMDGIIKKAESHMNNQNHLKEAQELLKKEDFKGAIEAAEWVEKDSMYFAEAEQLQTSARGSQLLKDALKNYNAGQAEKAMELLKNEPSAKDMVTKMAKVVQAVQAAGNAIKERELDKAIGLWNNIVQWEADKQNFYNVEAQNNITTWGSPKKLSSTYKEWGDEAFQAKKYKVARMYYEKSKNFDPELATKPLDDMKKLAFHYFNTGYNMKDLNKQKTLEYLSQVIDMLPPDDRMYMESEKLIEKLNAEGVTLESPK